MAEQTADSSSAARPKRVKTTWGRQRIRVVYLDHCAALSGGELALCRLVSALDGVDPHVILAEGGPLVHKLRDAGISVEVLPMDERTRNLHRGQVGARVSAGVAAAMAGAYAVSLARRLRQLEPDLVHTNSLKAALYGGLASRLVGVPVIWHLRDRIAPDYLPKAAVVLVKSVAQFLPTAVIANSRTSLDTLGRHRGPQAIITSPVIPLPVRRHIGPGRPAVIGILGRLAPWKGQDLFLRAFARAFPDGSERAVVVGSVLFGETDYELYLRQLVKELAVEDRVTFAGFRADVADCLEGIDFLVHASVLPEPLGQAVLEGMAAGLAVVAAGAGGPAETISHGVDGLLYPPGDEDALASILSQLVADPDLRHRLGEAACQRSAAWTPEVVAGEVLAFYGRILAQ